MMPELEEKVLKLNSSINRDVSYVQIKTKLTPRNLDGHYRYICDIQIRGYVEGWFRKKLIQFPVNDRAYVKSELAKKIFKEGKIIPREIEFLEE